MRYTMAVIMVIAIALFSAACASSNSDFVSKEEYDRLLARYNDLCDELDKLRNLLNETDSDNNTQPVTDGDLQYADTNSYSSVKAGEIIKFGGYDWRVLEVQNGKALIITEYVINVMAFDDYGDHDDDPNNGVYVYAEWENSSIRHWLNSEFIGSFNNTDKMRILDTLVINDDSLLFQYPLFRLERGINTTDKAFLLSIDEVVEYFGDSGALRNMQSGYETGAFMDIDDEYNETRSAYIDKMQDSFPTIAENIFYNNTVYSDQYTFDEFLMELSKRIEEWPIAWWLRTSSFNGYSHPTFISGWLGINVSIGGIIQVSGLHCEALIGVRPAMWIVID